MNEHVLQVGNVAIPYRIRFSDRAKKRRIEVTLDGVLVIAPSGSELDGNDGVFGYVRQKRGWIYDNVRAIQAKQTQQLKQQWVNGAKLMYRGRNLMLKIEPQDVDVVTINCRSKFHVAVPRHLKPAERPEALQIAFGLWLREGALKEAQRFTRRYSGKLGVKPQGVRIGAQKWSWGTCGKDGVLRINWELIQAPAAAMEYVVAHEVAHLGERNHSRTFWSLLGEVMDDWVSRKRLLEHWESESARRSESVRTVCILR